MNTAEEASAVRPDPSLLRSSVGFLVAGALIVAGLIAGALWLTDRINSLSNEIVSERGIRRAAIDLQTALIDVQSDFRGFLVTDDPAFLVRYEPSLGRIQPLLAELEQRLADRHGDAAAVDGLAEGIDETLAFIAETLAVARAGDLDAARARVAGGAGRVAMETLREPLANVIASSDARIVPAIAAQRTANGQLLVAVIATAACLAALVAGAIQLLSKRVRELTAARAEMQSLNQTLEERVDQRTHDLMQANQEIQRFAYIVTHDLRAPLVNIMGFTSELEAAVGPLRAYVLADGDAVSEQDIQDARLAAAEDLPEAIEFIRASARKMDGLINAILKIARDGRRQLRPERIDLEELATTATDAVRHQIGEAGGSVTVDIAVPSIFSDRLSLDQILGNLVDNAIKYSCPARPLALTVRARPAGRGHVRVEVADNGRGIAPEDHQRIFELFRRSGEQDKPGEGIGLAHVRSLARNLGGEITVASRQGEGSTFVLRLPIDLRHFIDGERAR